MAMRWYQQSSHGTKPPTSENQRLAAVDTATTEKARRSMSVRNPRRRRRPALVAPRATTPIVTAIATSASRAVKRDICSTDKATEPTATGGRDTATLAPMEHSPLGPTGLAW